MGILTWLSRASLSRIHLPLHRNHHCHPYCTYNHTWGRSESRHGESSLFSYLEEGNKPPNKKKICQIFGGIPGGRMVTCGIEPRIGSWWISKGAVMWKENTEIESEGFPSKRAVREKCKRHGWLKQRFCSFIYRWRIEAKTSCSH